MKVFTNTGCAVDVQGGWLDVVGEPIVVTTPVGAKVQATVTEVHGDHSVAVVDEDDRYPATSLRLYFNIADCPDVVTP